jgi:hypothetical protein
VILLSGAARHHAVGTIHIAEHLYAIFLLAD